MKPTAIIGESTWKVTAVKHVLEKNVRFPQENVALNILKYPSKNILVFNSVYKKKTITHNVSFIHLWFSKS